MITLQTQPSDTQIATLSAVITYTILQIDQYFIYPNLFLLICFVGIIILELATRFGLSKKQMENRDTTDFQFESNVRSKLMLFALVFLALIFDWVAIETDFFSASTTANHFISRGTILYLIAHQGVQVMRNIYLHEGANVIPPVLSWFVEKLRDYDKDKLGKEPPYRRPYDDDETVKKIIEQGKKDDDEANKG